MSRLFKLKPWLTLPEAANYLSRALKQDVSEADILRLALDWKLKISVIFVADVLASFCKPVVNEDEVKFDEIPSLDGTHKVRLPIDGQIVTTEKGTWLQIQKEIFELENDWPYVLTMMGGERGDIELKYWTLAGGPQVETKNPKGTFVKDGENVFQLKDRLQKAKGEPSSFYPIGGLPKDTMLVVTHEALSDLEKNIAKSDIAEEKALGTTERNILLTIIAALCREAKLDYTRHAKTAGLIQSTAAGMGLSIGESTIEGHLKKIPNALAGRMK